MNRYESAKEIYSKLGIDTDAVLDKIKNVPISLHCWQGDDVTGFDRGIFTDGNYVGKAKSPEQLLQDIEKVISLCPGKKKINVHACYAIFEDGEKVDRDKFQPKHFKKWVELAKKYNTGLDFNPTFFSHPMVKDNQTLTSTDETVRRFWINHGKACVKIAQYFAEETGYPCIMGIWIGDGIKDNPADRMGPRMRYKEGIEEILSVPYDKNLVKPCVESKLFGAGVEAFTAGSAEFTLCFAATHEGCLPLMDNGHYHPTEVVSDKIPALLCYFPEIALHITRGVHWDSDHVVIFDDETKEIAKEIVRNDALDRVYIALDYCDGTINRIASWSVGFRSCQKALLSAMLTPNAKHKELQESNNFTQLLVEQEALKMLPFGDVWNEYCTRAGVPTDCALFDEVTKYEKEVLIKR